MKLTLQDLREFLLFAIAALAWLILYILTP